MKLINPLPGGGCSLHADTDFGKIDALLLASADTGTVLRILDDDDREVGHIRVQHRRTTGYDAAVPTQPCAGCGKGPDLNQLTQPGGADRLLVSL